MSQAGSQSFPTTRWTSVERAGGAATISYQALAKLLPGYMGPLRAHLVLHKRFDPERADDLLQAFVAEKVLERGIVADAVRGRGRFRTFLLVALDRFVSNQIRNEGRKCRAPDALLPLEAAAGVADDTPHPSEAFDLAWARQVLALAAERMRDQCDASGRLDVWRVFEARVLSPALRGNEPVPFDILVPDLGLGSADAASNLVITAKRMFARSLAAVIGEYMGEDGEIEQEIAELRQVLAKARA